VKVFLRTFGCRANQYDSEGVREMISLGGGEIVEDPAVADFAIFNSCAVTAAAESELRRAVRKTGRIRPGIRSIVMGCAAGLEAGRRAAGHETLDRLPGVEAVVAGADLASVADVLGIGHLDRPPAVQTGTRALLRIQDGCDEHCTFCATTLARGASRSRPPAEIVAEASRLAERHPEIVLTGVHIGSYGLDIGSTLGGLVERLTMEVGAVRFRLSSLEATEVDDRLFGLLVAGEDRLAPHLHAPLQSGSDRVLRRMGRHWYTAREYAQVVGRLSSRCSSFGLGADLVAGFPGETEADHRLTVSLVEDLPFTYLHVFPYSPRQGTAATRLSGPVAGPEVTRRAAELRAVGERKSAAYASARDGGRASAVVMRGGGESREALTEDYLVCWVSDPRVPGGVKVPVTLRRSGDRLLADL
jgi:threonylcarbamoyladenosine tRNA methylthiotransferase MtaB